MKPCSITAGQLRRSIIQAPKILVQPNADWTNDVVSVELTAEEWINILALLESRPVAHADEKTLDRANFQYLDRA